MRASRIERVFRQAVRRWRPIVGVADWQVFIVVDNDADCVAQTVARPKYRECELTLNALAAEREALQYRTPQHIEYLALHELCHVFTWVLTEYAERQLPDHQASWHNEHATTKIARALWVARYHTSPPE